MNGFLDDCLDRLTANNHDLTELVYVVPSRRVARELSHKISEREKRTYFEPSIFSVEEYMGKVSGLSLIDEIDLQFLFYEVYQELGKQDNLETFLSWAPKLIQDFEEVDRHLVPAKQLFSYLGDVKELESREWITSGEPSPLVSQFVAFWKSVYELYKALYQALLERDQGYSGMLYREAFAKAKNKNLHTDKDLGGHHVFMGLNALNKAEEEIIKLHLERNSGSVFWDFDKHFQQKKYHEAGTFLRKYTGTWDFYEENNPQLLQSNFGKPKDISIEGISGNVAMAQRAAAVVRSWLENDEYLSEKVVVLADEQLLIPLMNALPEELGSINITMGQALSSTQLAHFFRLLLDVLLQLHKTGQAYHRDVFGLEDSFNSLFSVNDQTSIQDFAVRNNLAYVKASDFQTVEIKSELNEVLSQAHAGIPDIYASLIKLCELLKRKLRDKERALMLEQLFGIYSVLKLMAMRAETIPDLDTNVVTSVFKDMLSRKRLNYLGDQQAGLQVMGLLETRALDFKEVVLLSANEGVLPAGKSQNSYIPFDIQIEYGLPTYREKDSVYAYHFYRLLQRTSKATLLYNTDQNALGSSEKSRFLTQLTADAPSSHKITEQIFSSPLRTDRFEARVVQKTLEVMTRLEDLCKTGFSPSSIGSYLRDPYAFYLQKVLSVSEAADVEESMAYNTMGTLVHEVLEEVYRPFLNELLSEEAVRKMRTQVLNHLKSKYREHVNQHEPPSGLNLILFNVAEHYVNRMLDIDLQTIRQGKELMVLELERRMETCIHLPEHGKVKLKGTVDRIDQVDGQVRVIDYKTGKVEQRELNVDLSDVDKLLETDKYAKALQVLAYAKMYLEATKTNECKAGIISFKNLGAGFMSLNCAGPKQSLVSQTTLTDYEAVLSVLLGEILDQNVPFTENIDL